MSEIIAYKDQNNEYFDLEIENSKPVQAKSDDALNIMCLNLGPRLSKQIIIFKVRILKCQMLGTSNYLI